MERLGFYWTEKGFNTSRPAGRSPKSTRTGWPCIYQPITEWSPPRHRSSDQLPDWSSFETSRSTPRKTSTLDLAGTSHIIMLSNFCSMTAAFRFWTRGGAMALFSLKQTVANKHKKKNSWRNEKGKPELHKGSLAKKKSEADNALLLYE
jgi:hypothetical protein